MALQFPNRSRLYDAMRRTVRFWGHDRMHETAFCVTAAALRRNVPDMEPDEDGLLAAFDSNRDAIYAAALRAYAGRRKGDAELVIESF